MTKDEKIRAFYKWLEEHEFQSWEDHDFDSATLIRSIKSMFKDIFDL